MNYISCADARGSGLASFAGAFPFRRHRVVQRAMVKGMAAQNAPGCQHGPPACAMDRNGLLGILGAGRHKTAAWRLQRRNHGLVHRNRAHEEPSGKTGYNAKEPHTSHTCQWIRVARKPIPGLHRGRTTVTQSRPNPTPGARNPRRRPAHHPSRPSSLPAWARRQSRRRRGKGPCAGTPPGKAFLPCCVPRQAWNTFWKLKTPPSLYCPAAIPIYSRHNICQRRNVQSSLLHRTGSACSASAFPALPPGIRPLPALSRMAYWTAHAPMRRGRRTVRERGACGRCACGWPGSCVRSLWPCVRGSRCCACAKVYVAGKYASFFSFLILYVWFDFRARWRPFSMAPAKLRKGIP